MIPRSTAPLFSCSTLSRSAPPGGGGTFWGAMGLLFQTLAAIVEKVFESLNKEQTNERRFGFRHSDLTRHSDFVIRIFSVRFEKGDRRSRL